MKRFAMGLGIAAVLVIPSLLFLVRRGEDRRAWGRIALLALLYPLIAIVPAQLGQVDHALVRWPVKTAALALYCGLIAWEAQSSRARSPQPVTYPSRPAPVYRDRRSHDRALS